MVSLTRFVDVMFPKPPGLSLSDKGTTSFNIRGDQCDLFVVLYVLPFGIAFIWG